jgi:hypothetical protein
MYKLNDKSKAICSFCESLQTTTFLIRDVWMSDSNLVVKNILVAVCDSCNHVIGIPQQSAEHIAAIKHTLITNE